MIVNTPAWEIFTSVYI